MQGECTAAASLTAAAMASIDVKWSIFRNAVAALTAIASTADHIHFFAPTLQSRGS